jgi:hypothetical protein
MRTDGWVRQVYRWCRTRQCLYFLSPTYLLTGAENQRREVKWHGL